MRLRQTDVTSHWSLIGLYLLIISPAVAIFVDVSYQSDLLGLSAVKAESSKLSLIPVRSHWVTTWAFCIR